MSIELLGLCREFIFRGIHYQVAPRDLFIESQFALWVMADAALDLERLRSRVPAGFFQEQMKLYNAKLAGKQFKWGSEDVHQASWSEPGIRELLWLKMKRAEAKGGAFIEREMLDEIAQDKEKYPELLQILYQQDYPDFFAASNAAATTPPTTSPASPAPSAANPAPA